MFPRFNIPSTVPQQTRGKLKPRIPARVCGVFHKFPTPYYGYYNKFNKENRFCIGSHEERQQNRRKKGEKKI